jgi:hypothetical protein
VAKEECIICGEDHPRCNAHKTNGQPCMRWPRDEEPVCQLHGGNTPQVRRAGAERRAAKAVEKDVNAVLGYSLDGSVPDVLTAMEGLAAAELARVHALAERVNGLKELRFTAWGPGTEQTRAEVLMLERATDRAMRFLEVLAKHKPDGEAAAAVNLLTSLSDTIKAMKAEE